MTHGSKGDDVAICQGLTTQSAPVLASRRRPNELEVEITEMTLLQDSATTLSILYQLRELGVRVAIDDFGTGYSSLNYLQSFPFDRSRSIARLSKTLRKIRAL
jgi:EAL domain-containing protein (putative c-di-GMP-specific phosphodiesterase class I)